MQENHLKESSHFNRIDHDAVFYVLGQNTYLFDIEEIEKYKGIVVYSANIPKLV